MSAYPESLSFLCHKIFHALPLWIVKPFFGFETEITLVALRRDGPGNLCHLATPPPPPPTHVLFTAFKLPPNCSSLFHFMTILALGGVCSKIFCKKKNSIGFNQKGYAGVENAEKWQLLLIIHTFVDCYMKFCQSCQNAFNIYQPFSGKYRNYQELENIIHLNHLYLLSSIQSISFNFYPDLTWKTQEQELMLQGALSSPILDMNDWSWRKISFLFGSSFLLGSSFLFGSSL